MSNKTGQRHELFANNINNQTHPKKSETKQRKQPKTGPQQQRAQTQGQQNKPSVDTICQNVENFKIKTIANGNEVFF